MNDLHPVVDLHCDLLSYLTEVAGADPANPDDIGCAVPHLRNGRVAIQVLAVYTGGEADRVASLERQLRRFDGLVGSEDGEFARVRGTEDALRALSGATAGPPPDSGRAAAVGAVLAIENAAGLVADDASRDEMFARLDRIRADQGPVLYISLTHFAENRFGGGNATQVGLKDDGRALLDYLEGTRIAVDLSHASDALAREILDHLDRHGLAVPVLASHSNFRAVCDHARNLPDELAREVIHRRGLIGINFLRAFVHPDRSVALVEHVRHGLELGGASTLCFGADFFCLRQHPDPARQPFFHPEHESASRYPSILRDLASVMDRPALEKLAHGNAVDYLQRIWGDDA